MWSLVCLIVTLVDVGLGIQKPFEVSPIVKDFLDDVEVKMNEFTKDKIVDIEPLEYTFSKDSTHVPVYQAYMCATGISLRNLDTLKRWKVEEDLKLNQNGRVNLVIKLKFPDMNLSIKRVAMVHQERYFNTPSTSFFFNKNQKLSPKVILMRMSYENGPNDVQNERSQLKKCVINLEILNPYIALFEQSDRHEGEGKFFRTILQKMLFETKEAASPPFSRLVEASFKHAVESNGGCSLGKTQWKLQPPWIEKHPEKTPMTSNFDKFCLNALNSEKDIVAKRQGIVLSYLKYLIFKAVGRDIQLLA